MLRMATVVLACFAVAVVGVIALGDRTARAEWKEYGKDWDESAPVQESLGEPDVEWTVAAASDGQSEITGYVHKGEGEAADNVELRIIALGRAYFQARVPAGTSFRVQVASFELAGGGA